MIRALSIRKDKDLELTFKREPNSCFVNNYFDVGFKAWWVNMDIKSVLNEYKFFFSEKELRELPDDSPNIFKKSNIDRYMERPNALFCNGEYSMLNHFCYAEFLAYYTLESKACEYQPDELDGNLIDN